MTENKLHTHERTQKHRTADGKQYENQLNDPTNYTKSQNLLTFVRAQVPFRFI